MDCIIYARYSTDKQNELSVVDQFRVCEDYAKQHKLKVIETISDKGISGAALGNRPGALKALAMAPPVLLVNDLTRLCRSTDLSHLIKRLSHKSVRVVGVQDGFDSDSETASMQAGMSGIMSEELRRMIRKRSHSAIMLRIKMGSTRQGKDPYDVPEIVTEMFERYANGEGPRTIANDFNRRGIRAPLVREGTRGVWSAPTIFLILRNTYYVGVKYWNKTRTVRDPDSGKIRQVPRPEAEWIRMTVDAKTKIPKALFDKVQKRLAERTIYRAPGRGGKSKYLLSGLLRCGVCGASMIVHGGSQQRYRCGSFNMGGHHGCKNHRTLERTKLEAAILAPVIAQMLSPEAIRRGMEYMRKERARLEARQGKTTDTEAQRQVKRLEKMVKDGLLDADTAAPALAAARQKTQATRTPGVAASLPWPTEKLWRDSVARLTVILKGQDVDEARRVLGDLMGMIRVLPEKTQTRVEYNEGSLLFAITRHPAFAGTNEAPSRQFKGGRLENNTNVKYFHLPYRPRAKAA